MTRILGAIGGLVGMTRGPKTAERAQRHISGGLEEGKAGQQPYVESGLQSNKMLQEQIGSGELGGRFEAGDFEEDPGYQFRLQQGEKALGRRQAGPGGGGYFSSQALQQAQDYGQGLADQTYNDAYNRWMRGQKNTYDILSGQQGQGRQAAGTSGQYSTAIGQTAADAVMEKENMRMKGLSGLLGLFDPQGGI